MHVLARAFALAAMNTGNRIAANIAIMAMTTSNSISVNPLLRFLIIFTSSFSAVYKRRMLEAKIFVLLTKRSNTSAVSSSTDMTCRVPPKVPVLGFLLAKKENLENT